MTDYSPIYEALERGNAEEARELLRPILHDDAESPEAWYLAARAARNAAQQRHFLEKATALDPLYAPAANALHALKQPAASVPSMQSLPNPAPAPAATAHPLASLERRAMAFALDQGALGLLAIVLAMLLPIPQDAMTQESILADGVVPIWAAIWLLVISLTHILYHVIFLLRSGQTPGKQIAGVKVIRRDETPLTAWDIFLRCFVGYIFNLGGFGMGFWWASTNPLRQGWHDLVADTLVIEEPRR